MPADPNCRLCPLGGQGVSTCVWGRRRPILAASVKYDAMAVGEAPGQQEDRDGRPFVGPAGREVDKAFDEAGLTDVYLTNAVKCLPRTTKNPKPEHIKACAPYLDEEIAMIRPKAILAFGAIAWHRLGGVGGITDNEGKEIWSEKYHCWIMPARHPAFILRQMGHRSSWMQVIHRFKLLLEGKLHTEPPVDVTVVRSSYGLLTLTEILNKADVVVYDFETLRIPWWHTDHRALTVSFSVSPGKSFVVPLLHPESPFVANPRPAADFFYAIKSRMTSPDQKHIAHQGVFDDLVWKRLAGYLPHLTLDTLALAHVLDENRPKALKWLGRSLLGWPDWGIDTTDLSKVPLEQVARYNGFDTAATWALRERLVSDLKQDPRLHRYFSGVVMPGLRVIERIVANGVHVNTATLEQKIVATTNEKMQAKALIPVDNPGSDRQIAKWLYEDNHLPILKTTENGAPSTDEETIQKLALSFPEAKRVLDYRKPAKNLSTYLLPVDQALPASVDGRMHYDVKVGPKTGRFASRFHTTPRDAGIRSIYDAPPGFALLQADYKQVEARLVAWAAAGKPSTWEQAAVSGGQFLAALADPKRDVYREMAASVLNKAVSDVTPLDRQLMGKVPTLAMLYDISPKGLLDYAWREYQIVWTHKQAVHIWNTFYTLWPEIRAWQQREEMIVRERGWNQSVLGRKIRLPDAMQSGPNAHEAMKTGLNMPIQSLASDITLTAAVSFQRMLDEAGNREAKIVGFVHDALLIETSAITATSAATVLSHAMLQAPNDLRQFGLQLPDGLIQVDVSAGAWGSKQFVSAWNIQRLADEMSRDFHAMQTVTVREFGGTVTLEQHYEDKRGNIVSIPVFDNLTSST